MNKVSKRILIYRNGAVGDTVLTAPVLQALRRLYPDSDITMLGHLDRCRLLVGDGFADRALSVEAVPIHALLSEGDLPKKLRDLFAEQEIVIWYGVDPEQKIQRRLSPLVGRFLIWPPKPAQGPRPHIIDHLLMPLEKLGYDPAQPKLELPKMPGSDTRGEAILRERGLRFRKPLLMLAPGGSEAEKRWPAEHFARFASGWCKRRGIHEIGVLAGETEEEAALGAALVSRLAEEGCAGAALLDDLSLQDVAAVQLHASLYIGNDSGPTHLAAGLGVPTLAVFICTDAQTWGPRGERSQLVQPGSPVDWEAIWKAAESVYTRPAGMRR